MQTANSYSITTDSFGYACAEFKLSTDYNYNNHNNHNEQCRCYLINKFKNFQVSTNDFTILYMSLMMLHHERNISS